MKAVKTQPASSVTQKHAPFFSKRSERGYLHSGGQAGPFFGRGSGSPGFIQTKLTVGKPGDLYEREADKVADQVVQRLGNESTVQSKPVTGGPAMVQMKCKHCEEEEKLQKKDLEEDAVELHGMLSKKPIFESNAEPPDEEFSPTALRRKCSSCEKEEQLQKKSRGDAGAGVPDLESRLHSSKGGGAPLPIHTQAHMESAFGADFSGVRVHNNSSAAKMSKDLNAQAFTHGNDIYFNEGRYAPESSEGRHLLAHELTHTIQQGHLNIKKKDLPDLQKTPATDEQKLAIINILAGMGVRIDDNDAQVIHDNYPDGIRPTRLVTFVQIAGENYTSIARQSAVRLWPTVAVPGGAELFVFEVGKGRAILLSSIGGQSIMLDAGAGSAVRSHSAAANILAAHVYSLTTSGLVSAPTMIKIGHIDADHFNAVSSVLNLPQMGNAVVELTRQQLSQAIAKGNWSTMNVQISQGQSIVQLNVTGSGIDVRKSIIGNMELTEFRSESASAALTVPGSRTYNKNNTSTVTVMRDIINNSTYVFTGDAEGRLLNEVVNMVGENAFRRIIGGSARNLSAVEFPHHGGAVNRGPDVTGMTRFLRLLFESSNGTINFFTQTSQNFSSSPSASIRYLDTAQIPVERVMGNPGEAGVRQISRGINNRITLNGNQIASVVALGNNNSSAIMEAYQLRDRILNTSETMRAMEATFRLVPGQGTNLAGALGTARTEIEVSQNNLNTRLNSFWSVLESAAQATGMRASADTTQLNTEVTNLQTTVRAVNLEGVENSIAMIRNGINVMGRVFLNSLQMQQALRERNVAGMNSLKGEQRELVSELLRGARAELGAREFDGQIRSAWLGTRAEWNRNYVQRVAIRMGISEVESRKIAFRSQLAINLSRQMQLNELAKRAQEGQLPRTAPLGMRSRVGAGIMAGIELLRIGLEFYNSYEAAEEATERRDREQKIQGLREVYWWEEMGVRPEIKLVGETFWGNLTTLDVPSEKAYQIINEEIPKSQIPDYKRVVVDDVEDSDLQAVIAQFYMRFMTMADWIEAMGNPEINDRRTRGDSNIWFLKNSDGQWLLKLWSSTDNEYRLHSKPVINQPLNELMTHLNLAQQDEFAELKIQHAREGTFSISDTAWIGVDRNAFVYNSYGNPVEIDFDNFIPTFVKIHTTQFAYRVRGNMALVKAANMETYRRLSKYYWVIESRNTFIDSSGTHHQYYINSNYDGYAYIPNNDLIQKDKPSI